MRALFYLVISVVVLTGCKARKLAKESKDSTSVIKDIAITRSASIHIDTSKVARSTQKSGNKTVVLQDSSGNRTIITPAPGTSSVIDADGTFHGQAQKVVITRANKSTQTINSDYSLQKKAEQVYGITDLTEIDRIADKVDSTHLQDAKKNLDAKPAPGPWPWVIGGAVVIMFVVLLIWLRKAF